MSRATEIYPVEKSLVRTLRKIKTDTLNSDVLLKYYHARTAEGISLVRINKCLCTLEIISRMFGKQFEQATKDDMVQLVAKIESKNIADWTKHDYKVILKHFFKWLRNSDGVMPPEVRWIKVTNMVKNKNPILPKDLLTQEEKMALLQATENLRDRALLEVFFESGRRLGEILTLHIRDVEFDSMGAKIHVNGKIGDDFARIISSARALAIWLDNHPLRDNEDAPVWIGFGRSNRQKQISYVAAKANLKKIAKRAGIKKRIFYYLMRHTRVDETLGILTEAQQCMMFGWRFGSRMPAVYIKRYGKHIDNAQAIMNGITPAKKENVQILTPKQCPRCNTGNSPAAKFCNRCGAALDIATAIEADGARKELDTWMDNLAKDPEKLRKLVALVKEAH